MQFDPKIAKELDTDSAIIYANIQYWCAKNKANDKHKHDGKYWTYNSIKAFAEQFNYLSEKQIRRCLSKLEDAGYISTGNYNKTPFDQTKWYSDNLILPNEEIDLPKRANVDDQTGRPIPYSKPYNKPYISEKEKKLPKDYYESKEYLSTDYYELKKQFLDLWNEARISILNVKKSCYNRLEHYLHINLIEFAKDYTVKEFKMAIAGCLRQKHGVKDMRESPKHFLMDNNFEKYLNAYYNESYNLYDTNNKKKQNIQMI